MELRDNLLFILYIAPIIGNVLLLVLVAFGSQSSLKSKLFLAPIGLMALWLLAQLAAQFIPSLSLGFICLAAALASIMAFTYYLATRVYTNTHRGRYTDIILGLVTLVFVVLSLSGVAILQVTASPLGISIDSATVLYTLQLLFMVFVIVLALYDLVRSTLKIPRRADRTGNYIMFIAALQMLIISGGASIFLSGYTVLQVLLYLSGLAFSIGIFIGIFRHGLFDVRQAIVRTVSYVLVLAVLAGAYYVAAYTASLLLFGGASNMNLSPINVVLALGLAFAFQPLKRFFDRVTNAIFYRDNYDSDEFFARLNDQLNSTTDLRYLLEVTSREIATTLKAEQAYFFIYSKDGHYISAGTARHRPLPIADANTIRDTLKKGDGAIVLELLSVDSPLRRILMSHKLEVVLPLFNKTEVVGFFILTNPLASKYTSRDIRVLQTIADGLVIAIQNALSVQEVKELNTNLQQRVDNATKELRTSNAQLHRLDKAKDDFISMASHQLRTPLTSVKGYISMVREGDAGKITKAQDQLLGEAFTSSERMVHLINDFLNVSRLQTGKFLIDKRPVNLAKVIEQELDSLMTNAKSRNLTFTYSAPKDFPMLNLDEDKMRQVVMNFSDNAIYYSTEGTKVKVKLAVEGKEAVFTVTDTGIGVPRAEQSQLFNKFYRASNARKQRPDGTGVGLYLAKKVIDAHGGKVIFESTEGKGSTFGFRLPIDELRATSDTDKLKN
jgi:signal transduction histidine kinase